VPPWKYGVAADAELHLAFDSFLILEQFFPIDWGIPSKYDSPHKGRRKVHKRGLSHKLRARE
jgi:hypothetical protein